MGDVLKARLKSNEPVTFQRHLLSSLAFPYYLYLCSRWTLRR